jgi:hypothetical protein
VVNQPDVERPIDQILERTQIIWAPPIAATVYSVDEVEGRMAAQQIDGFDVSMTTHSSNIGSGNVRDKCEFCNELMLFNSLHGSGKCLLLWTRTDSVSFCFA